MPYPMNSVGILPLSFLENSDEYKANAIGKRRRKIPLRKIHAVLKTKQEKPFDLESYLSFLISNYAQHLRKISRIQVR